MASPAPPGTATADPSGLDIARKLLARTYKAAAAYGRDDLAERIVTVHDRISDDALRVMVVGEFKHGKSTLLNALLGAHVSPVDADIATSAPIVVRYGPAVAAHAVLEDAGDGEGTSVPFAIGEIDRWATEGGNPGNHRRVRRVEVALPHPVLEAGLSFIDTPGVGGLASTHGTITAAALPMADAVLFVSDAAQEFSANELEFLRTVVRICPTVAHVTTKIDVHHNWRRIVELDAGHLDRAGFDLPRFAVSALLREIADETDDAALVEESGMRSLLRWLGSSVARAGRRRTSSLVAAEVDSVAGQLAERFEAERAVLSAVDPAEIVARMETAKARAEQVKSAGGRWASVMSDGFGDLSSDIDHDMRGRLRDLNRKIDEMIDGVDPADAWAEFEPWLYRETGAMVTANYELLVERVRELVVAVVEVFGDESDGAEFVARLRTADELVSSSGGALGSPVERPGLMTQGLALLRGGYGSGMFGMYAGMAGIVLSNPVSAALALVMGGKGLRDERERALNQRRSQAKAAAHRYVDEVNFVVGKDSRDTMRHLQRDLRAFFVARSEESMRSSSEALAAAQRAMHDDAEVRQARLADVEAELGRIGALRDAAAALAAADPDAEESPR